MHSIKIKMACHTGVGAIFAVCTILHLASTPACASVEWYRTAQNTADRLTKKDDLTFGEDFSMDEVVEIKRLVCHTYLNQMTRMVCV